ncbi:MAG: phage holin family protein [Bacteroidales bacterium]|nr:phage holin family protein [Candidatus Colimorpha onthohippi]
MAIKKIIIRSPRYSGKWGFLAQVIVMTLASLLCDWILPGVRFDTLGSAILTGLVISLLNNFIRPILIVITLPFTILSMGLFLLVVNALIITLAAGLVHSFHVDGFGTAVLFGLLLTLIGYLLELPNQSMRRPHYNPRDNDIDGNLHRMLDSEDDTYTYADYEEIDDDDESNRK